MEVRRSFFPAVVVSILLYGCTTWTLTKRMEKKLDSNSSRMLRAILNKSWRQQLYVHRPPITKTIQVRRTRHAGLCWRSRDELISDVLLWTPSHGRAKARRPARTYIQQHCTDMGCCSEDLPEAMDDREGWLERISHIGADGATWWWWWWYTTYESLKKRITVQIKKDYYILVETVELCANKWALLNTYSYFKLKLTIDCYLLF